MKILAGAAIALLLSGCGGPSWPKDQFPTGLDVKRTLFEGGGGFGLRETCVAIVVELTREAVVRMIHVKRTSSGIEAVPPSGWVNTPVMNKGDEHAYYESAFGGCNNDGDHPLGDLPGALQRPGAFYKVINGGEGIAIIAPRAKLAAFFYFG